MVMKLRTISEIIVTFTKALEHKNKHAAVLLIIQQTGGNYPVGLPSEPPDVHCL